MAGKVIGVDSGKGQDAFEIAGHRLPVSVVAIGATVLVALIVMRHRSSGAVSTAGVGPVAPGYDPSQASTAQLGSDLAQLQNDLTMQAAQSSGALPSSTPAAGITPSSQYGSANFGPTSGGSYVPIAGGFAGVLADSSAGLPVYYQPFGPSGPYVEVPPSQIFPGSGYDKTFVFEPGGSAPAAPAPTPVPVSMPAAHAPLQTAYGESARRIK